MKKRDGIQEILASKQFPGVVCRLDPDHVAPRARMAQNPRGYTKAQSVKLEQAYQADIEHKRKTVNRKSNFRMTHSIPAELFHGKIKETGDRSYWDDERNRNRHRSTKVS